jgi:hypothetical protein
MMLFNSRSERNTVDYYVYRRRWRRRPLGWALWLLNGPNDGLVSTASATGKYFRLAWDHPCGEASADAIPNAMRITSAIGGTGISSPDRKPVLERLVQVRPSRVLLGLDRVDCHATPSMVQEQGHAVRLRTGSKAGTSRAERPSAARLRSIRRSGASSR